MKHSNMRTIGNRIAAMLAVLLVTSLSAAPAAACAVCMGDKNSDMVKGAAAGVMFMVVVVYGMFLCCFAPMLLIWRKRARRLAAQSTGDAAATNDGNTHQD